MYSSIQHKSMESFCQRGTTDHVLPSTLTHDPVNWKRMSISHNLLTLIELLKSWKLLLQQDIHYSYGQNRVMEGSLVFSSTNVVLSVLRITAFDYSIGILKLFSTGKLKAGNTPQPHTYSTLTGYITYVFELCIVREMF